MSKTTIRSTLDKYGSRRDADRALYRRANEEYESLKKGADTLLKKNPSLHKKNKDSTMGITERTFNVDLIYGYENLYAVLRRVEEVPPDTWATLTFLLKSQKKQTWAGHGNQKQQPSSASKNGQHVSTIQVSNNSHGMQRNSPHHSQNRQSKKTATDTRHHNQILLHHEEEIPQIKQKQYTDQRMVSHQDQAGYQQSRQTHHQSVLDPLVNHPDSNTVHEMRRLVEENRKLREETKIPNHIYESLQRIEKENNDLKLTLREKGEQIDEMTTRLSRYASQQLTQGNPHIADLSDANRPTKIGERFSAVYDDEWSDAYEILKSERKSDEDIVSVLAEIVKDCLEYAKKSLKKTTDEIIRQSMNVMVDPYHSKGLNNENKLSDIGKGHLAIQQRYAKDFIKLHAPLSIPNLKKEYVSKHRYKDKIRNYEEVLVELTWLMVVQDPPMMLQFINPGDKISEKSFKAYQRSGKIAKVCVWPAVYLHENGPIVAKGFVLPRT